MQIVVATLMNLCDDPTRVAGQGNWREMDTIRRIPIVVTGVLLCLSTSRFYTSQGKHVPRLSRGGPVCRELPAFSKLFSTISICSCRCDVHRFASFASAGVILLSVFQLTTQVLQFVH